MSRSARVIVLVLVFGALGGLPAHGAATTEDVLFRFNAGKAGKAVSTVYNGGSAATRQQVISTHGGGLVARSSPRTGGLALDYPGYDGAAGGPRAVVAVTSATYTDVLTPGAGWFRIGADLRLDATSYGTAYDNGNNVLQRGLATDAAQFKLQVDTRRPSCRVKGDLATLQVGSSRRLKPATWYRVSCVRQLWKKGDHLLLTVAPIRKNGTLGPVTTNGSRVRPLGALSFDLTTPLSVGGKLAPDLSVVSASDQFNGLVDNAFLNIP